MHVKFAVADYFVFKCPARILWINFQACTAIITKNKQDEPGRAPAPPTAARRQPGTSASQNATTIDVRNTPTSCLWIRRYIMGSPCNDVASYAIPTKVCFIVCYRSYTRFNSGKEKGAAQTGIHPISSFVSSTKPMIVLGHPSMKRGFLGSAIAVW